MPAATVVTKNENAPEQLIAPVANPVHIIGDMGKKYYWSSQSHMGYLRGHVTVFEFSRPEWTDLPDDPMQKQAARAQLRAFIRNYTPEEQAALNRAFEKLGTNRIVWNYVSGPANASGFSTTGFVWYAEDDDDVAFAIRHDLSLGGDGQFIKEIPQDSYLRVGDKAYANNDLARKMAFEEMERSGQPIVPEKKAS